MTEDEKQVHRGNMRLGKPFHGHYLAAYLRGLTAPDRLQVWTDAEIVARAHTMTNIYFEADGE